MIRVLSFSFEKILLHILDHTTFGWVVAFIEYAFEILGFLPARTVNDWVVFLAFDASRFSKNFLCGRTTDN
jgi:hypothetical protein